ncbi:hypothetical protein MKX03_003120 [Papaver bracteatum]|nr:hypothetical protein MKX03_003120 [Papaver bracteatum]
MQLSIPMFEATLYELSGNNGANNDEDDNDSSTTEKGLDSTVIQTFPLVVYSDIKNHKKKINAVGTLLDCAVCLGEYEDEDELRLLTKCRHVFHRECIDGWLESHSTCPVCRSDLNPTVSLKTKNLDILVSLHNCVDSLFLIQFIIVDVQICYTDSEIIQEDSDNIGRIYHKTRTLYILSCTGILVLLVSCRCVDGAAVVGLQFTYTRPIPPSSWSG